MSKKQRKQLPKYQLFGVLFEPEISGRCYRLVPHETWGTCGYVLAPIKGSCYFGLNPDGQHDDPKNIKYWESKISPTRGDAIANAPAEWREEYLKWKSSKQENAAEKHRGLL